MPRHPQALFTTVAAALQLTGLTLPIVLLGLFALHQLSPVRGALEVTLIAMVVVGGMLALILPLIRCPACQQRCFSGDDRKHYEGFAKSVCRTFFGRSFVCPHCAKIFSLRSE